VRTAGAPGLPSSDTLSTHSHDHRKTFPYAPKSFHQKAKLDEQLRLTANRIADVLQRQKFILYCHCGNLFRNLCRALMLYGSPSHRLEESLKATSRALEIDGMMTWRL
jgi:hypothetical protein